MIAKIKAFQMLGIWMEESGLRQIDLAEKLGVTRSAVNRWCKGTGNPQKEQAKNIARLSRGVVPEEIWARVETTSPAPGPQQLREIANRRAISVSEMARLCQIEQGTMARYIDGRSQNIRPDRLKKINRRFRLQLTPADFRVQA